MDVCELSAADLAAALQCRELWPVETPEAVLQRADLAGLPACALPMGARR